MTEVGHGNVLVALAAAAVGAFLFGMFTHALWLFAVAEFFVGAGYVYSVITDPDPDSWWP